MVTKTEEEQVNRLENQVENGGGGAWEYLCLVRKLKLRRSDKVLKFGLSILNEPKKRSALGPEGEFRMLNSVFTFSIFYCFLSGFLKDSCPNSLIWLWV